MIMVNSSVVDMEHDIVLCESNQRKFPSWRDVSIAWHQRLLQEEDNADGFVHYKENKIRLTCQTETSSSASYKRVFTI
jgi:hypothetical protein